MSQGTFKSTTVIAVVVANMIGTGVFTSLGFQLFQFRSGFVLLMLWVVGGLVALCGAMTYAELGAAMPRSGGEYNFLSRIYHPAAGFVSGWVSATIGFAGPGALAAMTFAAYTIPIFPGEVPAWTEEAIACGLVVVLAAVHSTNRTNSGRLQVFFTVLKVAVIAGFCVLAWAIVDSPQPVTFLPIRGDGALIASGAFAVSLIYVSYAYTGWNAATYLSSELENPQRALPVVLLTGTLIVTVLYVALNGIFLYVAPMGEMAGKVDIGYIAATAAFGDFGGRLTGLVMAALLISTVSAMIMAGPRVLQVIGEDFPALSVLSRTNENGIPSFAIFVLSSLTIAIIVSSRFESVLVFTGFTLALNSFVTVLGVFVLRFRQPDLPRPYRVFMYPVPPLVYLALTGWTLWFVMMERPVEGLFGVGIIATGMLVYGFAVYRQRTTEDR